MYITVIFSILLRISFGLDLFSELYQPFKILNGRNVDFSYDRNKRESIPIKEDETDQNTSTSINSKSSVFDSSILEDSMNNATEKESEALHDSILEYPLETVVEESGTTIQSAIFENSLDSYSGRAELKNGDRCNNKGAVTSFPGVPSVSIFVNTFIKAVRSSALLTIAFNFKDATPIQYSKFKYRYLADFLRRKGFVDANKIAAFFVHPITKYFDVLLPQVLLRVLSNAFADFMLSEGILTADNAEEHALIFFKATEESAKINQVNKDSDYTRKFKATIEGSIRFFFTLGELTHSKAWKMAFYIAHEWLLAALDFGTLRSITIKK